VVAVCAGERRGEGKVDVGRGYLREGYGLVGDAHAGPGDRQVSLIALADVESAASAIGLPAGPGDFAANIGIDGLNLAGLPPGTRLRVGEAVLVVTHIGKKNVGPHHFSLHGIALLVERGVFCRVLRSGWVQKGDPAFVETEASPQDEGLASR